MEYAESALLLFALLNPFLLVIYLLDLIQQLDAATFRALLLRAALIAGAVFAAFAAVGETIFSRVLHAEFASFQIFGGIVFVLIGLQFVFKGPTAMAELRGEASHAAGAIAMPVLVGPGTISASVVVGQRHDLLPACAVVLATTVVAVVAVMLLKALHDIVRQRHEEIMERYIEIAGRISSLYIGTIAVEMIMQGVRSWAEKM